MRHCWCQNFFRYFLRLRRYNRNSVEVGVFRRKWVNLSVNFRFRRKGSSPTNHCWCQKTIQWLLFRVSCGIKISTVHCLVLSQSRRVTDGRTERLTELYDSWYRASMRCMCRAVMSVPVSSSVFLLYVGMNTLTLLMPRSRRAVLAEPSSSHRFAQLSATPRFYPQLR